MRTDPATRGPSRLQNAAQHWVQLFARPSSQHICLILAVALSASAQRLADERSDLPLALGMFLVGALAYALCMYRAASAAPIEHPASRPVIHTGFMIWAAIFSLFAFFSLRQNHFTVQGLIAWLLSMGLCLVALGTDRRRGEERAWLWKSTGHPGVRLSWPSIGLIVAIAIGIALRFYDLRELPADLGWDLPYNYTDAERILRGEHLIFFPDNYGREGMFFYLIVAVSNLVHLSPYSIRVTSALVGIATIPAIYLLAQECHNREAGSYAALFLAFNRWHISLTRSGYRVSLMPLFCILALYGAARVLRRGQARDWALLGLILGLGMWTYKAFAFAVVTILGTLFIYACLRGTTATDHEAINGTAKTETGPSQTPWRHGRRRAFLGLGLIVLVMLIAAVPMIRVVVDAPEAYLAREGLGARLVSESVEREGVTRAQLYLRNIGTSVLMFNYKGDANARFGVPFERHMGFVSGVLFVFGVALALSRFRQGANGLLLISLPGLIAPMTISMLWGEVPNCFRSSGVLGPSLVLVALALVSLRSHLSRALEGERLPRLEFRLNTDSGETRTRTLSLGAIVVWAPLFVVALAMGLELQETKRAYFVDFRHVAPRMQNYSMAVALSERMIAFDQGPAVIKVWPHWYDGRAVREHLAAAGRAWDGEYVSFQPDQPPLVGFRGQMLVLTHPEDAETIRTLQAFFPRWTTTVDRFPNGELSLVAFYGER